jgi:hypothetical protein
MVKYGCRLAEGEICRGHEVAIDDPVAQLLSRYFTVSIPGKARMDHSPGELEGEIDFTQRDMAIEYLLMPERVKKLEGQLAALNCDLERIGGCLDKLTAVLGKRVRVKLKAKQKIVHLKAVGKTSMWLKGSSLMAVKTCSKALLARYLGMEKSMLFYKCVFCGCLVLITQCQFCPVLWSRKHGCEHSGMETSEDTCQKPKRRRTQSDKIDRLKI